MYLGRGWSVITNPSQGVSGDWDVKVDHLYFKLALYVLWWLVYPCSAIPTPWGLFHVMLI